MHPALRVNEMMTPLWVQLGDQATRGAAWEWLTVHVDALIDRLPRRTAGWLPAG